MKNFLKKIKNLINKNDNSKGVTCIICSIIGLYLAVVLGFITAKMVSLPKALLLLTTFLVAVASIVFLIFGIIKVVDWDYEYYY